MSYGIVIPGKPMTWARAQANFRSGKPHYFTAPDREAKMGEIAMLWRAAGHPQLAGPLALTCEFIFDRPMSHFRKDGSIPPKHMMARPGRGKFGGDIDNLVKLVQDALNTVGYRDDSQIAELTAIKRYGQAGELSETRVELVELPGQTPVVSPDALTLLDEACEQSADSD